MWIGLIGMLLLIIAWIPEIQETIKNKGKGISLKFVLLMIGGDFFLLIHSIIIQDLVFIILNGILLGMALLELYYCLRE